MRASPRLSEDDLVRLIRARAARSGMTGVRRSIGDDAAVLEPSAGTMLLATTDLLVENVHFRRRWAEPADIGWKAMAVNVSDVAAMGGTPRWALVALACPDGTGCDEVEAFYEGALALCDAYGVVIVGGDTSSSPAGWTVNVTLLGEAVAPLLRSTARPGDVVAVTGALGRAAAGLTVLERERAPGGIPPATLAEVTDAHLRPRPRVAEGRWLGGAGGVTAMMDLSDGIATDLPRLVAESGTGATVDLRHLPVADAARAVAAALDHDPIAWATGGGEDYELLLTCERGAFERLRAGLRTALGTALTAVGEIRTGHGVRWRDTDGRDAVVTAGFEHFSRG
jgi:thiamine-monophosphate kinase